MMALCRQRAHERKMQRLTDENKDLQKDVEKLEDALHLHARLKNKDESSVKGLIRKEVGGSIWQHGGEGKLSSYKGATDLGDKWNSSTGKKYSKHHSKSASAVEQTSLQPSVEKVGFQRQSSALKSSSCKRRNTSCDSNADNDLNSNSNNRPSSTKGIRNSKGVTRNSSAKLCLETNQVATGTRSQHRSKGIVIPRATKESFDENMHPEVKETKHDETRVEVLSKMINNLKNSLNLEQNDVHGSMEKEQNKSSPQIKTPVSSNETSHRLKSERSHKISQPSGHRIKSCSASRISSRNSQQSKQLISPAASNAVNQKSVTDDAHRPWDPILVEWLHSLNLRDVDKYVKIFTENEIDMESLKLVTEKQLNAMGIVAIGTVNKLMQGIRKLKTCPFFPITDSAEEYLQVVSKETPKTNSQHSSGHSNVSSKESLHLKESSLDRHAGHTKKNKSAIERRIASPGITTRPQSSTSAASQSDAENSAKPLVRSTRTSRFRTHMEAPPTSLRTTVQDNTSLDQSNLEQMDSNEPGPPNAADLFLDLKVDGAALGSDRQRESGDEDAKLQHIEDEIKELCTDMSKPGTIDIISRLQDQLKDIHQHILDKKSTTNRDSTVQISEHTEAKLEEPQEAENNPPETKIEEKSAKKELTNAVVSQKTSKSDLLKEVRKQKELHRREIRHLESELSRLKHKDPLRSCELVETEVYYTQQDLIGEGAFSQVYRGLYQGSEVAVKQLKVPLSAQDKNYFMAEVNLLKDLRHPRVVLLVGVCTTSKLPLMVLEYMSNGSLYDYLRNEDNPSLDHAAYYAIARDTALGMNYLHQHRPAVLHLDLKSMNILLSTHLRAKIADFGFSKLKHDANIAAKKSGKSAKSSVKGTPAWLAPELLDNKEISTKADVYSFAIILNEMLTRAHPYPGCSVFQIIERVRNNKRPEIPKSCPKPLRQLISNCWHKNTAVRPSFKDILTSLEKLQFPPEWKALFAAAGVPARALDDVTATRSLIAMVTQSVEGGHVRPEDVPALQLYDSDEDEGCETVQQNVSGFNSSHGMMASPSDPMKCTSDTEEEFYAKLARTLKSPLAPKEATSRSCAIEDDVSISDVTDEDIAFQDEEFEATVTSPIKKLERLISSSSAGDAPGFDFNSVPSAPPPPPLPSFDWGGKSPRANSDNVYGDLFADVSKNAPAKPPRHNKKSSQSTDTQATKNNAAELRASQLVKRREQLRPAVQQHPQEQLPQTTVTSKVAGPRSSIRASQLVNQRNALLSTDQPHPNQLADLSAVQQSQLTNLAEILRKAVNERRTAIGNTATLDSVESDNWSHG